MSEKHYYKTIVMVTVLHDRPIGEMSLSELDYAITDGACSGVVEYTEHNSVLTEQEMIALCEEQDTDPDFFGIAPDHACCVCGEPAEGTENVCECVCPVCQTPTFDDVTIADHGCCYDCFQKRRMGEPLPLLTVGTRVFLDLGDNGHMWGIIKEVDVDAYPDERTPYLVFTLDETQEIGWYGDGDFEAIGGSSEEEVRV